MDVAVSEIFVADPAVVKVRSEFDPADVSRAGNASKGLMIATAIMQVTSSRRIRYYTL